MPTGVAIRDPREQLFDAAERVLLRDGPSALTTRGHRGGRLRPLLTEATAMIASYLVAERERGRVAADADIDTLAPTLIGAAHLLFAGREGVPPSPEAVRKVVTTVLAAVIDDQEEFGAVPRSST